MHEEEAGRRRAPVVMQVVGDVSPNGEAIGLQIENCKSLGTARLRPLRPDGYDNQQQQGHRNLRRYQSLAQTEASVPLGNAACVSEFVKR